MKRAHQLNAGYLVGPPQVSFTGMKSLNDPVVRAKSSESSRTDIKRLRKVPRMSKEMKGPEDMASSIITGKTPMLRVAPPINQAAQNNDPEAIEVHMVAYYYAALTNLFCQVCLSPIQQGEDNYAVRAIIDASYRDFQMLDAWLGAVEQNEIRASSSSHLYLEVRDRWRDQVKDWITISKKARNAG
jgi:hypothetical protein